MYVCIYVCMCVCDWHSTYRYIFVSSKFTLGSLPLTNIMQFDAATCIYVCTCTFLAENCLVMDAEIISLLTVEQRSTSPQPKVRYCLLTASERGIVVLQRVKKLGKDD